MTIHNVRAAEQPIKPPAGNPHLHTARHLGELPNSKVAPQLLSELATAPCAFAPVPVDLPLALYGAGSLGRLARDFLAAVGEEFAVFIDRDARRIADDPDWAGVPLLHPDRVPPNAKRGVCLLVCVATSPYVPLERALSDAGFKCIVPFYDLAESFRHLHPLSNGWFAAPLSVQEQKNTAEVLSRWDDDVSRAHHLQFLAWRRLREEWAFAPAPMPECARFFIPEVAQVLHDHEIFLDAGAHHGAVTHAFAQQTKGAFRQVIAIEPDPATRGRLEDGLQGLLANDKRVEVLDCALGEAEREAPFHNGLGYASQLASTGRLRAKVRSVDALGLSPTFIKLHLEGGELAALKGARQTLLSQRPIIAATIYHNADGIWKTPLWLMQTLPDYRFLLRLHSWCGTGAVIYAIPTERRAS